MCLPYLKCSDPLPETHFFLPSCKGQELQISHCLDKIKTPSPTLIHVLKMLHFNCFFQDQNTFLLKALKSVYPLIILLKILTIDRGTQGTPPCNCIGCLNPNTIMGSLIMNFVSVTLIILCLWLNSKIYKFRAS